MAILIDLDQTLINSQSVELLRAKRLWSDVYKKISELQPYEGISELLQELKLLNVPICIVTSSPRPYCEKIIKHWGWKIDATVCYHDTDKRKPYPDPIHKGLVNLGLKADKAVAIGDAAKDTQAAKTAGVTSIGALWGSLERSLLTASQPDIMCTTVQELREILLARYGS